jgi:hypothetical protein
VVADGRKNAKALIDEQLDLFPALKELLTRRVLVEQHIGFALESAQRYYILESGRVTSSGTGGSASEGDVRAAMAI